MLDLKNARRIKGKIAVKVFLPHCKVWVRGYFQGWDRTIPDKGPSGKPTKWGKVWLFGTGPQYGVIAIPEDYIDAK